MHRLSRPAQAPAAGANAGPWLAVEGLDCYRLSLEFHLLATTLVPRSERILRDQLERASISICLNLAEGIGRGSAADQARFFTIARGSATECAAIVDLVRLRRIAPEGVCLAAREKLIRIVQMLTKLEARTVASGLRA